MITIYDPNGRTIASVPITKDVIHEREMMTSNFVRLSWYDVQGTVLQVGSYIIPYDDGIRYVLLDPYAPTSEKHKKFKYEPQFEHPIMWLRKLPFIHREGDTTSWATSRKKFDWTYTGVPQTLANEVPRYINWLSSVYPAFGVVFGTGWTARIAGTLPATASFSFESVDVLSACAEMANVCECEYHFDFERKIFYFGQVSYLRSGSTIPEFKCGRNVGVPNVSLSKEDSFNCFVVKGGTRNISQRSPSGDNVQVTERLPLKESKYPDSIIDKRTDSDEPKLFKELIFDDIYPKMELYLYKPRERRCWLLDDDGNKVETTSDDGWFDAETQTYYKYYSKWYIRLAYQKDGEWHDYTIDPETDLIKDKPLSLAFQPNYESKLYTCPLIGKEYELVYFDKATHEKEDDDIDPDGFTAQPGDYRIVFLDGDIVMPSTSKIGLCPKGASYPSTENNIVTLFNIVVDEVYKEIAKDELEAAGLKAIARLRSDLNIYTVPSNPVYFENHPQDVYIGMAAIYDDGKDLIGGTSYRLETHVRKIVSHLDHPNVMEISLGNEKIKGSITSLKDKVDALSGGLIAGLSEEQFAELLVHYGSQHFLSKEFNDIAEGVITFLKGARYGNYKKGESGGHISAMGDAEFRKLLVRMGAIVHDLIVGNFAEGVKDSGAHIDEFGNAEFETIITRGLAQLQELFVVNDSTFGGNLSSIDFISAFLGGKGWAIQKQTRVNSAGVEEEYYTLEIDSVTVRETLRVYEMVISQLRGEFDNYVFAAMMEVHHYDPLTGKVWLSTEGERIKAVPFRQGDYIKVQQYKPGNDIVSGGDGYITKGYEMIVTDAGTGGMDDEQGDRLDWVKFKNFTSTSGETAEQLITKKDTFVRVDNETDTERKGLMQIITVGPNTPYQDVIYGLKTDPNDYLKVRIGNLGGLRTDLFGWLESYGAYLPNLYAVGKMYNRQTGESLNSSVEITRERLKSVYTETTYNIDDDDNFLKNGFFARGMESWTKCAVGGGSAPSDLSQQSINSGDGTPLMVNGAVLSYQSRMSAEVGDYLGMKMLHLLGMGVYQSFSDIKLNGTHKVNVSDNEQSDGYTQTKDVPDRLYIGIRIMPISAGTLTISFLKSNGTAISTQSHVLNASKDWQLEQFTDSAAEPWNYNGQSGRLIVSYTGECYIRFVALMTDPVVNTTETYSTLIEQTSRRITLQAAKQTADLNQAIAEIEIEFDHVRTTVTNNKTAADAAFSKLTADLNAEIANREDLEDEYYGTWVYQNNNLLSLMAAQFNSDGTIKGYSALQTRVDGIDSTVTSNKTAADNAFANVNSQLGSLENYIEDVDEEQEASATWIQQNKNKWSVVAASFKDDGTIKAGGRIALYVSDSLSTFEVDADKINFKTGNFRIQNQKGDTTLALDANGNLTIGGTINGGNITGDIAIGNGTNKMYIRPNQVNGAELVGIHDNSDELINLGFTSGNIGFNGRTVNVARPKLELSFYLDGTKRMSALYESYRIVIDGPSNEQTYIDYDTVRTDRISADQYLVKTSSSGNSSTYTAGASGSFTAGSKTVTVKSGIITNISS